MVFQSYALWPHMTVAENVAFGLDIRKTGKSEMHRQVQEALAMVQMQDRFNYKPSQLSGGQQQRVALARALVIRPECLLLDEPLSNLDSKLRLDMRGEIRRICKSSGLTAVYVTHDQNEALSIADRIAILNEGQIQQLGSPQEIYRQPQNRFVAGFIGETNFIDGTISHIESGAITVDTALGPITCARNNRQPTAGSAISLSIRPEAIRLRDTPAEATNVFSGTAFDTLYLGELAQHRIKTQSNIELKAVELNPRLNARDGAQAIRFWFAPEDVTILCD
jgi:iron(III) transport system ATP-binding protein